MQLWLKFNESAYWPASQASQASSSDVIQFNLFQVWPSPVESGSKPLFKCDPALQQRIRECSDFASANRPFEFCQLVEHNNCLNAAAPTNTTHQPKRIENNGHER